MAIVLTMVDKQHWVPLVRGLGEVSVGYPDHFIQETVPPRALVVVTRHPTAAALQICPLHINL